MFDVAGKIDNLRKERGWSIYRLAIEAGLSQQTVHAWYDKVKPTMPSIQTLEIVCDVFEITLVDFFAEEYPIELTPTFRKLYKNLCILSKEELKLVDEFLKIVIKRKN